MISLIVARDKNGAIGRDGVIPWDIPADLAAFQRETTGGAIIMGRRTWESLPVKPLPRRCNIVVSSRPDIADMVAPTPEAAVAIARDQGYGRIYGIGGAEIYRDLMPFSQRMLVTDVDLSVARADSFFPPIAMEEWYLLSEQKLQSAEPACVQREYIRLGQAPLLLEGFDGRARSDHG